VITSGIIESIFVVTPVETVKTKLIHLNMSFFGGVKHIVAHEGMAGVYQVRRQSKRAMSGWGEGEYTWNIPKMRFQTTLNDPFLCAAGFGSDDYEARIEPGPAFYVFQRVQELGHQQRPAQPDSSHLLSRWNVCRLLFNPVQ
jgi:hypothetical protein